MMDSLVGTLGGALDNSELRDHLAWLKGMSVPVEVEIKKALDARKGSLLPAKAVRSIRRVVILNLFFFQFSKKYQGVRRAWKSLPDAPFNKTDRNLFCLAIVLANSSFDYKRGLQEVIHSRRGGDWALAARLGRPAEFENFTAINAEFIGRRFFERFNLSHRAAPRAAVKYLRKTAIGLFLRDSIERAKCDPSSLVSYITASRRIARRTRIAALISYMPQALSQEDLAFVHDRFNWAPDPDGRYLIKGVAEYLGFKSPGALYTRFYKLRQSAQRHEATLKAKAAKRDEQRRANKAKLNAKLKVLMDQFQKSQRARVAMKNSSPL
jgi:hypothetical protein